MESLLFYLENSCGLVHRGSQESPADLAKLLHTVCPVDLGAPFRDLEMALTSASFQPG
jgi:hypothetical protein